MDLRADVRRYLASRLAECEARPDLTSHSIAAYRRAIATVDGGGDLGDLFDLAKADSLDRYRNLERLYESLGDERKAAANRTRYEAAAQATGHADLVARVTAAHQQAEPLEMAANRMNAFVATVFELLLALRVGTPQKKRDAAARLEATCAEMRTIDPGWSPARWLAYRPYRNRIPYDEARLRAFVRTFEEAVR